MPSMISLRPLPSTGKGLTDAGFILRTGSLGSPYSLEPVEIKLSHQLVNDWFDLKAVVQIGNYSIPFTRLRRNILEGITRISSS